MGSFPGDRNGYTMETIRPRLEKLYRSGMSYEQMAERLDLHERTVRYWLRRIGIGPEKSVVDAATVARMVALWHDGWKQRDIARAVGRGETTVRRHLKARGLDTAARVNRSWRRLEFGRGR